MNARAYPSAENEAAYPMSFEPVRPISTRLSLSLFDRLLSSSMLHLMVENFAIPLNHIMSRYATGRISQRADQSSTAPRR